MMVFFLALEMGVVIMLGLAGFLHVHQSLSTFTHPHMAGGHATGSARWRPARSLRR